MLNSGKCIPKVLGKCLKISSYTPNTSRKLQENTSSLRLELWPASGILFWGQLMGKHESSKGTATEVSPAGLLASHAFYSPQHPQHSSTTARSNPQHAVAFPFWKGCRFGFGLARNKTKLETLLSTCKKSVFVHEPEATRHFQRAHPQCSPGTPDPSAPSFPAPTSEMLA